jgi:hypothetical protein
VCTVAGDAQGAGAIGAVTWAPLTAFAIGAKIVPTAGGSFVYRVCGVTSGATSPFLSGATEPVWPTSAFGAQVDDGGLVMQLFNWSTAQAVFKPFGLIGA